MFSFERRMHPHGALLTSTAELKEIATRFDAAYQDLLADTLVND
jgi:hypothetical protein